jgi:hypothetical protein
VLVWGKITDLRAQLQFLKQEAGNDNSKSEGEGGDPKLLEAIREAITPHQEMLEKLTEIVTEDQRDIASFKKMSVWEEVEIALGLKDLVCIILLSLIHHLIASNASFPAWLPDWTSSSSKLANPESRLGNSDPINPLDSS